MVYVVVCQYHLFMILATTTIEVLHLLDKPWFQVSKSKKSNVDFWMHLHEYSVELQL